MIYIPYRNDLLPLNKKHRRLQDKLQEIILLNRIDFHSIATILLGCLIDADYSQMDFIYMLFGSFANDNVDFAFDNGLVCKWIKGQSVVLNYSCNTTNR